PGCLGSCARSGRILPPGVPWRENPVEALYHGICRFDRRRRALLVYADGYSVADLQPERLSNLGRDRDLPLACHPRQVPLALPKPYRTTTGEALLPCGGSST